MRVWGICYLMERGARVEGLLEEIMCERLAGPLGRVGVFLWAFGVEGLGCKV